MSLDAALSIASSGLSAINQQLALISHNVANASTPGYATRSAADQHDRRRRADGRASSAWRSARSSRSSTAELAQRAAPSRACR